MNKEYEVTITEILQKTVNVEASSKDEAEQIAEDMWRDEEIVLTAEDFTEVEYKADNGKEISDKTKDKIEVLLVEPGEYPKMVTIGSDLESLQKAVGGDIEAVYWFDDPVAVICNEEGKMNGLPLNRALRDENNEVADIVVGTFFVCGLGKENFGSLPKEFQEKYEKLFHSPEKFLKMSQKIMAIPFTPKKEQPPTDKKHNGMEL